MRLLKELVHSYDALVSDTTRVMNRVKAIYRGRAIGCAGRDVYLPAEPGAMAGEVDRAGSATAGRVSLPATGHAERLRREAKKAMLKESRRHPAYRILKQIPVLGPIRIAQILAKVASPHRFRTKRQFWAIVGWRW